MSAATASKPPFHSAPRCDVCGEDMGFVRSLWTKTCQSCDLKSFSKAANSLGSGMPPGTYMKQRRLRAGLSVNQCAERIAFCGSDRLQAAADLKNMEANRPGDYLRLVQHLEARKVFPFEMSVFLNLSGATADPSAEMVCD